MLYNIGMGQHKNNHKKLWFRAKTYGWGWVPVTWQGWAVTAGYTLIFTLLLLGFFAWIGPAKESGADAREITLGSLEFLAAILLLSYTLYRVCRRFGEKPRWRWGKDA